MTQPTYTKYTTNEGREYILRVTENETSSIPIDESNSDYQAYLKRDEPQASSIPAE
jgi:hypothetical protein